MNSVAKKFGGFRNSVAMSEVIEVSYENVLSLLKDIKKMGESNILFKRNIRPLNKELILNMDKLYKSLYSDAKNSINSSFEIITVSGWN